MRSRMLKDCWVPQTDFLFFWTYRNVCFHQPLKSGWKCRSRGYALVSDLLTGLGRHLSLGKVRVSYWPFHWAHFVPTQEFCQCPGSSVSRFPYLAKWKMQQAFCLASLNAVTVQWVISGELCGHSWSRQSVHKSQQQLQRWPEMCRVSEKQALSSRAHLALQGATGREEWLQVEIRTSK